MGEIEPQHETADRISEALRASRGGGPESIERLMDLVLADLRRCASRRLATGPSRDSLRPTELINETYLRLFGREGSPSWEDRRHFFAAASRAMQHVLADRARRRRSRGGRPRQLSPSVPDRVDAGETERMLLLDQALRELDGLSDRQGTIVRMKFFAGLTIPEIAQLLEIGTATVERDWTAARAWLRVRLGDETGEASE